MKIIIFLLAIILVAGCTQPLKPADNTTEYNATEYLDVGKVVVRWFGHSTLGINNARAILYINPYNIPDNLVRADFVLIGTRHFYDCSEDDVGKVAVRGTEIYGPRSCIDEFPSSFAASELESIQGFSNDRLNITVTTVPAYNINKGYTPKGQGFGFIIEMSGRRMYFAGDTDLIPEMGSLGKIDVAFLPINGKYTMSVEEAAEAAKIIKPAVVVPIAYGSVEDTFVDPTKLKELLKDTDISVIILKDN